LNMKLARKRQFDGTRAYAKSSMTFDRNLANARARVAYNTHNDRIRRIIFHTLRHWKASMLYHQIKDIVVFSSFWVIIRLTIL
jgi:hypothetical protein